MISTGRTASSCSSSLSKHMTRRRQRLSAASSANTRAAAATSCAPHADVLTNVLEDHEWLFVIDKCAGGANNARLANWFRGPLHGDIAVRRRAGGIGCSRKALYLYWYIVVVEHQCPATVLPQQDKTRVSLRFSTP